MSSTVVEFGSRPSATTCATMSRSVTMAKGRSPSTRQPSCLPGVRFPAEKEQVASTAESNGAPQDMVSQIRNADTERFGSPEEVMQALQSGLDLG